MYTLVNTNLPTNGSVIILNAIAANEESFETQICLKVSFVSKSLQSIWASLTSIGLGKNSTAASITICTQIFCRADPQTTGYN